jgi:hypothetical protein
MDIVRITPFPRPTAASARARPSVADSTRTGSALPRRSLTDRLNAEWTALVADPTLAAELAREPLAGHHDLASLLDACGGDRSVDADVADEQLARLVAAGLEGRGLAVRVTLQRMLGAIVAIAVRRTQACPAERVVLFDELLSTAWLVIGSYPLGRRPRRIAANIARDTEYLTCVRPGRLHDTARRANLVEELLPPVDLHGSRQHHPRDELFDLLLDLEGPSGLGEHEVALLHALAAGRSTRAIADDLGCTDRTVRNLRRRLTDRLQELTAI